MTTIARQAFLHRNSFWVLGASSRDDRRRIVQLADDKSLELDHDLCQKARSELTSTRTRLAAEIAWLPGVSPRKAEQLATRIITESTANDSGIPPLAYVNLMVAAFETIDAGLQPNTVAERIQELASGLEELVVTDIRRDINEDRAVSGFPEITDDLVVEAELSNHRRRVRDAVKETLNLFPTEAIVSALTQAVALATGGGAFHAPALIDELVSAYEVEAHEFLEKEASNIQKLTDAARSVADIDPKGVGELIARIGVVARNWDKVAQPIQVSAKAQGIAHVASNELASQVRSLAVHLFNEYGLVAESRQLTELLQEVFAEVASVAERAEQDAGAIDKVVRSREEWSREISYEAEIGIAFKGKLRISPAGISWKGENYRLEDITRVRWGGVRHSVNGIPTGTTYTLAFGDDRSEEVVELRREDVYSTFLEKLWRAVCSRLMVDMVKALRDGADLTLGDAVIRDGGVLLKRHSFTGPKERVPCEWHEVHIWSADGSFYIGAQKDDKVYAALSYIHVSNVHILEQVIRTSFKQGGGRLSDILNDE